MTTDSHQIAETQKESWNSTVQNRIEKRQLELNESEHSNPKLKYQKYHLCF